jgi:hypothetical protein
MELFSRLGGGGGGAGGLTHNKSADLIIVSTEPCTTPRLPSPALAYPFYLVQKYNKHSQITLRNQGDFRITNGIIRLSGKIIAKMSLSLSLYIFGYNKVHNMTNHDDTLDCVS